MLCSEAILVNQGPNEGHATILRCKRWGCELCNPFNHRRIKRAAREGKPNVFLTLTVNPSKYETPDAAARDLKTAWVNLRRAMERDHNVRHPAFIAIFEKTKSGWPHLHILMRCKFIAQAWYSDTMKRLIGAPIVDVRFIQDTGRVAAYVAKYISKAPEMFTHCKRWWRSHDYQIDKEESEPFRRFSPHTHEWQGDIYSWLWRAFGGRATITEKHEGYWHWMVAPEPPIRREKSKAERQREFLTK